MWQVATCGRKGFSTRIVYDRVTGLDLQTRCGFSIDFRISSKNPQDKGHLELNNFLARSSPYCHIEPSWRSKVLLMTTCSSRDAGRFRAGPFGSNPQDWTIMSLTGNVKVVGNIRLPKRT